MLISSVFVIHSHFRPEVGTIDSLKSAFLILKQQRNTLGIETPKIFLLCRDAQKIETKDANQSFESLLQKHCELDAELMSQLTINGRPKPPDDYLKDLNFDKITGTSYLAFVTNFMIDCIKYVKKEPALVRPMGIEAICKQLDRVSRLVNSDNFSKYFQGSLEEVLLSIATPIRQEIVRKFEEESLTVAKEFEVKSYEAYKSAIEKIRKRLIEEYDQKIHLNISIKRDSPILLSIRAQVNIDMKSNASDTHYFYRCKLQEQSEEMNLRMSQLIEENNKKEDARQRAIQALSQKQENLIKQLEDTKIESEKVITQMKNDNEIQLNECRQHINELLDQQKNETKRAQISANNTVQNLLYDLMNSSNKESADVITSQLRYAFLEYETNVNNIRSNIGLVLKNTVS
jgi:hypothetical protein